MLDARGDRSSGVHDRLDHIPFAQARQMKNYIEGHSAITKIGTLSKRDKNTLGLCVYLGHDGNLLTPLPKVFLGNTDRIDPQGFATACRLEFLQRTMKIASDLVRNT